VKNEYSFSIYPSINVCISLSKYSESRLKDASPVRHLIITIATPLCRYILLKINNMSISASPRHLFWTFRVFL